jgi:hypothetical protein
MCELSAGKSGRMWEKKFRQSATGDRNFKANAELSDNPNQCSLGDLLLTVGFP